MTIERPQTVDPYAMFARFYDLEFDALSDDLDLYRQFAREAGGPILELGCGTGRVLEALADLGLPLTGVDISPAMLEIARERLSAAVSLIEGDFRDVSVLPLVNAPFWLAFSALNTFLHLPDQDAHIATLVALRQVVVPGGLMLLDLFIPDPHYLTTLDGRVVNEFSTTLSDGTRLAKFVARTHDAAIQAIDTSAWFDLTSASSSVVTRYADSYRTRYIHRFELEHLLARSGWELVSLFGSYDLAPFGPDSERMIVLATWRPDRLPKEE